MTLSRGWLTLGALSLLLPERVRLGIWLPLHLALAGAISAAISGAMQNFVLALTASPAPPAWIVWLQLGLVTVGAGTIAVARVAGSELATGVGGALFVAGIAVLGWIVLRARRRSLHGRHGLPIAMYLGAIVTMLAGGTLGALIGPNAVGGELWLGLRQAHAAVNLLGWVSFTIGGTLVTFLPTVLRIRMPRWEGWSTVAALALGLLGIGVGLGADLRPVAGLGGLVYAAGALGLAGMVVRVLRVPRTWPVPTAARHLLAAAAWFEIGALALAVALARGGFLAFREPYLAIFVVGWALQTLLGAWLFLLPMNRPGHPDERRRQLAVAEVGGALQVASYNLGVALLALAGAGWVARPLGAVGAGLALAAGGVALAKAWAFAQVARLPVLAPRHLRVWGADAGLWQDGARG
jgi:nitrite reductase (NO-forming)